jgi:hypothetical protein
MGSKIAWRPRVSLWSDGILAPKRRRSGVPLGIAALLCGLMVVSAYSVYLQLAGEPRGVRLLERRRGVRLRPRRPLRVRRVRSLPGKSNHRGSPTWRPAPRRWLTALRKPQGARAHSCRHLPLRIPAPRLQASRQRPSRQNSRIPPRRRLNHARPRRSRPATSTPLRSTQRPMDLYIARLATRSRASAAGMVFRVATTSGRAMPPPAFPRLLR